MLILQTLPEELRQLKTVYACMKRIMESYGSIKIGELAWLKSEDQGVLLFLFSALWLTMSMDFIGTFTRQVEYITNSARLYSCNISSYSMIEDGNRIRM